MNSKNSKIPIGILIVIVLLLITGIQFLSFSDYTDRVKYTVEFILAVITVFGLFIAAIQLKQNEKTKKLELDILKTEKSLDMMNLFSQLVVDMSMVVDVFSEDQKYCDLLSKVDLEDYIAFNTKEFNDLYPDKRDRDYLQNMSDFIDRNFNSISANYITSKSESMSSSERLTILRFIHFDWNTSKVKKAIKDSEFKFEKDSSPQNNETIKKHNSNNISLIIQQELELMIHLKIKISTFFLNSITHVQNKLEYFSAHFITNIANEEIAYHSLHQLFFSLVKYLYPSICQINDGKESDEYYTFTTTLFVDWNKKHQSLKDFDRIKKDKSKSSKHNTSIPN